MADRFFASYEDEFQARPNAAPVRRSEASDARYYDAPEDHWSEQQWSYGPSDPTDSYPSDDFTPKQPMFAPLDRRAVNGGRSYPAQTRQNRPSYDPDHPRGYEDAAPNAPIYGRSDMALPAARIAKITQWAGTVCSVLVLLGTVYWAYELAVRDARGIPVVRAAEGPLRIAPTSPGGEISANQGLAVNAIAAKGGSETLPDVVTLAPAPTPLTQEDVAETSSAEAPAAVEMTVADTGAELGSETPIAAETAPEPSGSALADLAAKTPDVMPISDEAAVEAALAMALSDGNAPASKSNTDAAQPAAVIPQDTGVTAPPTAEVDPATIPAGTKMVQLGAFDDDAAARAAWAALQTQFTDLIGPKALVVQQAKSGGRVFFRLRAHGFADEDETRRFCAALLAENASCIPVSQR